MDRYADLRADLARCVLESPATLDRSVRAAIAADRDVPDALAAFSAKVHRHAYRVTDEDVAALRAAGYSEDQIFEAVISAALGASQRRLDAALAAMNTEARDATRTG
jgi:alkylhydroperoxidase family enzyme